MGVSTGAALLFMFVVGSDGFFFVWPSCPYKNTHKDPRVCGSNGITYETTCAFKVVQTFITWLKLLYYGPCKKHTIRSILETRTYRKYHYDDDDVTTTTRRRRTTTPSNQDGYGDDDVTTTTRRRRITKQRTTTPDYKEGSNNDQGTRPRKQTSSKQTPPRQSGESGDDKQDVIVEKPSNATNKNIATNENAINIKRAVDLNVQNQVKNTNKFN